MKFIDYGHGSNEAYAWLNGAFVGFFMGALFGLFGALLWLY